MQITTTEFLTKYNKENSIITKFSYVFPTIKIESFEEILNFFLSSGLTGETFEAMYVQKVAQLRESPFYYLNNIQ